MDGFFLRAESLYQFASELDALEQEPFCASGYFAYGGKSLHEQSHGESFFSIFMNRFDGHGLFMLDEPEAALFTGYLKICRQGPLDAHLLGAFLPEFAGEFSQVGDLDLKRDRLKTIGSIGLFELFGFLVLYEDATYQGEWSCCSVSLHDSNCEWGATV
jgi:hypothetical protein